jgi:hypothetical protein
MRFFTVLALSSLLLTGCGGNDADDTNAAQEESQGVTDMEQAASETSAATPELAEAESFYKERVAKGDTIAMPYEELQKYMPTISGYTADGAPSGASQTMGAFSMSTADQHWTETGGDPNAKKRIHVTLVDFGGTQMAYATMAAPMMMQVRSEDAHRRIRYDKGSIPTSYVIEELDKDNNTGKVTTVTRYRYLITVEQSGGASDPTEEAKAIANEIAQKFDGK